MCLRTVIEGRLFLRIAPAHFQILQSFSINDSISMFLHEILACSANVCDHALISVIQLSTFIHCQGFDELTCCASSNVPKRLLGQDVGVGREAGSRNHMELLLRPCDKLHAKRHTNWLCVEAAPLRPSAASTFASSAPFASFSSRNHGMPRQCLGGGPVFFSLCRGSCNTAPVASGASSAIWETALSTPAGRLGTIT